MNKIKYKIKSLKIYYKLEKKILFVIISKKKYIYYFKSNANFKKYD